MAIGEITLIKAAKMVEDILLENIGAIDKAYLHSDEAFDIGLKVRLAESKAGVRIDTSISFVSERVRDKHTAYCDEAQGSLFSDATNNEGME